MKKIGITGSIGSGKTTVCRIFEMLGVPVYYADAAGKKLMEINQNLKNALVENFGKKIISDEKINHRTLAEIVFKKNDSLQMLNALVHPLVFEDFENWCMMHVRKKYVLMEAAILFESGAENFLDAVITVTAPEKIRLERILHRGSETEEQFRLRQQNQRSEQEKAKRADFIIVNDEKTLVIPQVLNIHREIALWKK